MYQDCCIKYITFLKCVMIPLILLCWKRYDCFPFQQRQKKKLITISQPGSWIVFATSNFLPKYVVSLQGDICRSSLQIDWLNCWGAERILIKHNLHSLQVRPADTVTCQKSPPAPHQVFKESHCWMQITSEQWALWSAEFLINLWWKVRSWCFILNARQNRRKESFSWRHAAQ